MIQHFPGKRNPFVDHPQWATRALFDLVNPATGVRNTDLDTNFRNALDATM